MTAENNKRKRLLIVDDEGDFLELLQESLSAAGYDVLTATNGFEALKIFGRMKVDAIVTDLTMPGMDGIQMISYLKVNSLNSKSPVFVVSGKLSESSLKMLNNLGIAHIVPKPIDLEELTRKIDTALRPNKDESSPFSKEVTKLCSDSIMESMLEYFPNQVDLQSLNSITKSAKPFGYASSLPIFGAHLFGSVHVGCDYQFIRELAKKVFMTEEIDITPEVASDMTGELANQVAGIFKRKAETLSQFLVIGLPITSANSNILQLVPGARIGIQVEIMQKFKFYCEFCLCEPSRIKHDETDMNLAIFEKTNPSHS